jgi:predicted O-methyltransferase YrrM
MSEDYYFTVDWFSINIPIWSQLIGHYKPARILEIGSFEGRSTCFLIQQCADAHPIDIYCIDTWEGGVDNDKSAMPEVELRFNHNVGIAVKMAPHAVSLRKFKKPSTMALAEIIAAAEAPLDFIYIDGSHQAPDVLSDAVLAFQLLRVGGVLIFDDYLWTMEAAGKQDPLNMPKLATDSFINIFQRKLRILDRLPIYQLYVEKLFH